MTRVERNRNRRRINSRRRLFAFLIFGLVSISITAIPSYSSYVISGIGVGTNDGLNSLDIVNGNTLLNLDEDVSTGWKEVSLEGNAISNKVVNPTSNQVVTYGPVYMMTPANSLSSDVDLQIQYSVKKIGGTKELNNTAIGSDLAKPFEVIVGDMDNFNIGVAANYDFYSGIATPKHSIDVYPKKYDAEGTDRRMVGSGFYELGKKIFTKVDSSNVEAGLKLPAINATTAVYSTEAYYGATLSNNITTDSGVTLPKNLIVYYDGYSDRGIAGIYQSKAAAADVLMDGANWRYLQKVRPIIFKYNNIKNDEGIASVSFQIFIDDMQSGVATNPTQFAAVSCSYYRFYMSDGINKIEIPEFAQILNAYAQSGPVGNIISLNLPEEYFKYIKNASGLNKGLSIIIDDTRVGTSGDSYAIDFAKMTVNAKSATGTANTISINGKVVDTDGNPIEGVKVTTGDGSYSFTNSSGVYNITLASPGILNLTFSHYKYKTYTYMYDNVSSDTTVDLVTDSLNWTTLYKGLKEEISSREKVKVELIAQKCNLDGSNVDGSTPIILSSSDLNAANNYMIKNTVGEGTIINQALRFDNLEPGTRYKISYKLYLKSYEDIGDLDAFKIQFSSRIRAKLTQENNPNWDEDGNGSDYETFFTEPESEAYEESPINDSELGSVIYFERPTTSSYWSDFTSGGLPKFYLNSLTTELTGGTKSKVNEGTGWYKYVFNTDNAIPPNSYIKVEDGANTSGKLYYFSTQNIYICTN